MIYCKLKQTFLVIIVALLMLAFLARPGLAIGPGTGGSKVRVSDETIGPFVLLVATSPLPVKVGQMSVWVRVSNGADTSQLRRDATVMVRATPRAGGPTLSAQATHQNAGNDYDYVAHFDVQETGEWDVTVSVEDELGQAEVSFVETVSRGLTTGLLLGLAVPFIVLSLIVGYYLWQRSTAVDAIELDGSTG